MSFEPYPKYKDSGVEWLGQVPEQWEIKRLKHQLARNDGGVWGDEPTGEGDMVVLRSTEQAVDGRWQIEDPARRQLSDEEVASTLLAEGDLLLTKSSGSSLHIGKTSLVNAEVAAMRCCYSNFMQRLRVKASYSSRLAWYFLNNEVARRQFDLLSNSTTGLANLNGTIIGDLVLPVPPRTEQATITAFLDRETAKIDALIAAQQRLIELLQEKRQAVIAHAVTKGLNPDVPMKDSGIEWLGEVPEHWKVASLRYFATFSSGATPDRANMNFWTGGIPWVKTGEINYGPIAATEEEISQEGLESSSCSIAPKGTLLMALYGQGATRGRVAILGLDAAFNQACVAITTDHRLLTQFLWSYFVFAYAFIRGIGNENTQMNMNVDYVRGFRVPLPPLDEQRAIAAHVNNESHRFEELCAEADRAITLLQERRSAVISAAVTGQIDVRGLAETSEAA